MNSVKIFLFMIVIKVGEGTKFCDPECNSRFKRLFKKLALRKFNTVPVNIDTVGLRSIPLIPRKTPHDPNTN